MPSSIASGFLSGSRVTRAMLYGTEHDAQLPRNLRSDARVPFLGFCGSRFEPGGPVLLAINPGGGGDKYISRTRQDCDLIPLIETFVGAAPGAEARAFERMSVKYTAHAKTWNLWRIMEPTIDACGKSIEDACYLNLFPYRTSNDVRPSAAALARAWLQIAAPLLDLLQPSPLVALGKKAGSVAEKFHRGPAPLFVVPRTIGDTYVSPRAMNVLADIRSATCRAP